MGQRVRSSAGQRTAIGQHIQLDRAYLLDKDVSAVIVEVQSRGTPHKAFLISCKTTCLSSSASRDINRIKRSSRQANIRVNALSNSREQISAGRFQNLAEVFVGTRRKDINVHDLRTL